MNLHHLKVFLAVAQTGSISAGAARLFISQPAVTREIRELEGRLQLALFDRQTRGVSLTEAGQRLLPYAEHIFALEREAERDLAEFASLGAGELRLCASATLGSYLLPSLIAEFQQQHPGLAISLQIGNTASSLRALDSGDCSLAFIEGPFIREAFNHHLLGSDALLPVSSPRHPLASCPRLNASELAEAELFLREEGSGTRSTLEQVYRAHGLTPKVALALGNSVALKRSLQSGRGVAWISELAIEDELRSGELVRLEVEDLHIRRDLHALWRRERSLSPAAHALLARVEVALDSRESYINNF